MNWLELDNLGAFLFWMAICGFFYWRGVISGYNTKQREQKSKCINIEIVVTDGAYLFYNLEKNKFLFQTRTIDEGKERCRADMEDGQVLMYIVVDDNGEPI
jgi:hypothetical protein